MCLLPYGKRLALLIVLILAVAQCRLILNKSSIAVTLGLMELSSRCKNDGVALSFNLESFANNLMSFATNT